ncbi:MAG: SIS domain-containing protein [bacterium]|nr:SIS domain-containing protein [bacterium]
MPEQRLKEYLAGIVRIFEAVDFSQFEEFLRCLREAYERERQIFVFSNGGSGANASHFASDFNKGVCYGREKRFKVICLNDNMPIVASYANDMTYDDIFAEQLKNFLNKDDLVIGVSGSGNSENVLRAIRYAGEKGGKTFGICGYGGGKLKDTAQHALVIHSNDMQKVEDLHMMVFHCAMQWGISQFNDKIMET